MINALKGRKQIHLNYGDKSTANKLQNAIDNYNKINSFFDTFRFRTDEEAIDHYYNEALK